MNARYTAHAKAAHASASEDIKPVAITLSSDLGIAAAANDDSEAPDARRVNPLWMITVGLAMFFALVALLTTFD
jgi:hypothetical protein